MKTISTTAIALALACGTAAVALAEPSDLVVIETQKRDFHPRGIATMDRLNQDGPTLACTKYNNAPPEPLLKQLEADQLATVRFPADGKMLGDWKRGQKLAQSGRGMTWSDKSTSDNGGGCYNCHQLSTAELSFGTLGPSLNHYGKSRGTTAEAQKYVYTKIYNAKAFNLCSNMPRFGYSATLSEQDIKDLTAYLLDPASPVNK